MIVEICLGVLFVTLILSWIFAQRHTRIRVMGELMPGPKRWPLLGNFFLHGLPKNGPGKLEVRRKIVEKFGHTTRYWLGNELYVIISDPDDIEAILNKTTYTRKDQNYRFLKLWLGDGILLSSGEKWRRRRKAISPAFHFKILQQFVDIFNKHGDILTEQLHKESGKDHFDIQPYFSRFVLDTLCETAMGVDIQSQKHPSDPYSTAVREMTSMIAERMCCPWQWNDFLFSLSGKKKKEDEWLKIIHDFSNVVIKRKTNEYIQISSTSDDEFEGNKKETAFLELLLNLSRKPDTVFKEHEDIREEVNTMMFAGHDTTTSALSSTLHILSKHQDVQEKVYDEIVQVMASKEFKSPSYQDLKEMNYLEYVIKETLRLYPPVPTIARELNEDIQLPSGYIAPKNAKVFIYLYFLHRNSKCFAQPEVFNPDNFLPENAAGRHPYAYMPFSVGQRNCIGQKFAMLELKSVITKILLKYKLVNPGPEWDVILNPILTLQSVNGFHVKLIQRDV